MKTVALSLMLVCFANAEEKNRVVVVRDPAAVQGLDVDAGRAAAMVSRGIRALTGKATDAAAWSVFVSSNDVAGIKVNAQAAPLHVPHRAVIEAIATGLEAAGVRATNIVVWDIDAHKLRAAGLASNPRYQVRAVVGDTGWDEQVFFESRVVGRLIWGDLLFSREDSGVSTRSHLPKLLTQTLTKLINVPVLQDHDACGLSGCLYNLSIGVVDNHRRFELTGNGAQEIPQIVAVREIRGPTVLHVLDALVGGYAGGPGFKPQYSWPAGRLYFSRDPVGVDMLGLELLEQQRATAEVPAIGQRGGHVAAAGKAGLGTAERAQLEILEVGP